MPHENLLIVADSFSDANMLFATRALLRRPAIYLRVRGRCHLLVDDRELASATRDAKHCRIHPLDAYRRRVSPSPTHPPVWSRIIKEILRERKLAKVYVPKAFPLGLARDLRAVNIKVRVRNDPFFPQRELKTPGDVKKISAAVLMAEVGLSEGMQILKSARVARRGYLSYRNNPLTPERLQLVINTAILQAGGWGTDTVVAVSSASSDPRSRENSALKANQPIILDVSARSRKTGYHGRIARTVVKGRADEPIRRLYHAVAQARETALEALRPGRRAADVHRLVTKHFKDSGYRTGRGPGTPHGSVHDLGFGLGLEPQEQPSLIEASQDFLQSGHVLVIAPGVFLRGIGGVRLADAVVVSRRFPRLLSQFERTLEL